MKNSIRHAFLLIGFCFAVWFAPAAYGAPYGPKGKAAHYTQPSGVRLQLRVFGDEYYSRTETYLGHTVVFDQTTKAYYYAMLSPDQKTLVRTPLLAEGNPPKNNPLHLDILASEVAKIRRAESLKVNGKLLKRWKQRVQDARDRRNAVTGPQRAAALRSQAAASGDVRGLTILVQFPGENFPVDAGKIQRMMNDDNYTEDGNTSSVKGYFLDQSGGKLSYTQEVTEIITMPNSRAYYNSLGPDRAGPALVRDALDALVLRNFNFTGLSADADGRVQGVNLFYAGEASPIDGLWPHRWEINRYDLGGGLYVSDYQITDTPDSQPAIGTFIHESGHLILNIPDLYDTTYQSGGLGYHCLMAAGSYNNNERTPAPINLACKDILGWATVQNITSTTALEVDLPSTGNVGYRIFKPGSQTEYFIVENRGPGDRWATDCPDQGLMIWHVDEAMPDNDFSPHYYIALEQADGLFQLESDPFELGDANDLFDISTQAFSDETNPAAKWWDNSKSGILIKAFSAPSSKMRVRLGSTPVNTLKLLSPNGGEKFYRSTALPITWEANVQGNIRIELLKGKRVVRTITEIASTAGRYEWEMPQSLPAGSSYQIRVTTLSNPQLITDTSDGMFGIVPGSFPANDEVPLGWAIPRGAGGWVPVKDIAVDGRYSLGSTPIADGGRAAMSYTSDFNAGTVSFYVKVSSEVMFDHFHFLVDGVKMPLFGSLDGLSGEVDWTYVSVPIPAGRHTLTWIYNKDDSMGDMQDRAWIDGVVLPVEQQEITVARRGKNLISGDRFSFGSVSVIRKSPRKKFVIRNTGTSPLRFVNVVLTGANKNDYILSSPAATTIDPGKSMVVKVQFAPQKPGIRRAKLRILSNDSDESQFDISLVGRGKGVPLLQVYQPASRQLKDGRSTVKFATARVGTEGGMKTFTLKNAGGFVLTDLQVSLKGDRGSFRVGPVGVNKLAPGELTTIKVRFHPQQTGELKAQLLIWSNDVRRNPFQIRLAGKGTRRYPAAAFTAASFASGKTGNAGASSAAIPSTITFEGEQFLTLAADQSTAGVDQRVLVEVSSDLIRWFSGPQHTTVLQENAKILRVRDNTPIDKKTKRYIRSRVVDR